VLGVRTIRRAPFLQAFVARRAESDREPDRFGGVSSIGHDEPDTLAGYTVDARSRQQAVDKQPAGCEAIREKRRFFTREKSRKSFPAANECPESEMQDTRCRLIPCLSGLACRVLNWKKVSNSQH
jgi:hypothetical protein